MARKNRGIGFWLGLSLVVLTSFQFVSVPFLSKALSPITPLVVLGTGIYLLIKG